MPSVVLAKKDPEHKKRLSALRGNAAKVKARADAAVQTTSLKTWDVMTAEEKDLVLRDIGIQLGLVAPNVSVPSRPATGRGRINE